MSQMDSEECSVQKGESLTESLKEWEGKESELIFIFYFLIPLVRRFVQ